jgi:hydroxymethylbilane synthase
MTATTIRLGARGSALSRAQADIVASALQSRLGVEIEFVPVASHGDQTSAPLTEIGGTGVFVGAVRQALLDGDVDVVVHSLKDLPTVDDDRVTLAAVPTRGDARDALVARDGLTLGELPPGSTVGTGSPRRAAQLRALGLGLDVIPIRGNVDTRLAKVTRGEVDAVVLARAGLERLGRVDEITETLDPLQMLPAPGQGALAVEVAATSTSLAADVCSALDDAMTRAACTAERAVLRALEAGCSAPIGALADVAEGDDGPELWLRAVVTATDGSRLVRLSATGSPDTAERVGRDLADAMLSEGAGSIMHEVAS